MTPTTAAVIPVSAAARSRLPRRRSTYGAPSRMKRKHGHERHPRRQQRGDHGGDPGVEVARAAVGADERDELDDHDQRPRGGLARARGRGPSRPAPASRRPPRPAARRTPGRRRRRRSVTTAAPEKNRPWSTNDARPAEQAAPRRRPGRTTATSPTTRIAARPGGRDGRSVWRASSLISGGRSVVGGGPLGGAGQAGDVAGRGPSRRAPRRHDRRERRRRRTSGRRTTRPPARPGRVAQPLPADADHRLDHDRDDRRGEAEEQRLDEGGVAVARRRSPDSTSSATTPGRTNRMPATSAPRDAVEEPADVRRQLLRLRPAAAACSRRARTGTAAGRSSASPRPGCAA